VIVCFILFLASLYGIGSFVGPQLVKQGQHLVRKLSSTETSPARIVDHILGRTVGEYLLRQQYGDRGSPAYQEALAQFQDPSRAATDFAKLMSDVIEAFDESLKIDQVLSDILVFTLSAKEEIQFREWIFKNKADAILETDRTRYYDEWSFLYRADEFKIPGLTKFNDLSDGERKDGVLHYVTNVVLEDAKLRSNLIREWRNEAVHEDANKLKENNPQEYERRLGEFYSQYHEENPLSAPFDVDAFMKLRGARMVSKEAFGLALASVESSDVVTTGTVSERAVVQFENSERLRLIRQWKKGELAARLQAAFEEQVVAVMAHTGKFIGELLPGVLGFPVQMGLILILSFLISVDFPRISRGVQRIKQSRAHWIYDEFAPFLVSFGRLIGRAFQAQGMIAVVNTLLTLISIQFLGIENAAFLCGMVFLCSFIPVLGVVLSSVPIAIMALVQEGGGLILALSSIGAILLIHFIETSLLNPKILGDMLHLHPVLVLTILAISEHFFGVWGLLLGIPVIVYLIRFIILDEGIPGFIEPIRSTSLNHEPTATQ
jgi:predicted PurR-regulated permease PerM